MNIRLVAAAALILCLGWASPGRAGEISLKTGDTMQKLLEDQKGKRVTVRLLAGEEMTGTVKFISKDLLQLGELAGKEFYDAIVDMSKVSAVIVRTK